MKYMQDNKMLFFHLVQVCDGYQDCEDFSDEDPSVCHLSSITCPPDTFRYVWNYQCIHVMLSLNILRTLNKNSNYSIIYTWIWSVVVKFDSKLTKHKWFENKLITNFSALVPPPENCLS